MSVVARSWRWSLLFLLGLLLGAGLAAAEPPPMATPQGDANGELVTARPTVEVGDGLATPDASGDTTRPGEPGVTLSIEGGRGGTHTVIRLFMLMTVLAIAPGFLIMMTSFTRIVIVLGFVRRALGTQTLPPNQVILGLSLFLTLFTMAPTLTDLNDKALQPFLAEEITEEEAVDRAEASIRGFMAAHTRKQDLALFIRIAGEERPRSIDDVSFLTLVPAFATSELKTAFQMGFIIFLPFIVIDLVIAAVLMSLGMMMLPPIIVSLPFKILLFVLVDGWALLVQSLVASYAGSG